MRNYIRHPLSVPIYCRSSDEGEDRKRRFVRNVSHGGLSFRSDQRMMPGELVRIDIEQPGHDFSIEAVVIWCNPQDPACFDVGVRFESDAAEFAVRLVEQACYIREYQSRVATEEDRNLSIEEAAAEWIARFAANFPR